MSTVRPDTTAVVVNYFSAGYTLHAVESILSSPSSGRVRVVVVDNSCDPEENRILRSGLPSQVQLMFKNENIGFGRACNEVFANSDDPLFLLLNPDALLIGDSLKRLQDILMADSKIGAVSPQAFWDEEFRFYIPPAHIPVLFFLQPELARLGLDSAWYRMVSWMWRRYSYKVWSSNRPVYVKNLCGGHVLLKRRAVIDSGGLFDPRFFLYFEDTDLFMRMRRAGHRLVIDPGSRAVHHYDQCDAGNRPRKRQMMVEAHDLFYRKNVRRSHVFWKRVLNHCSNRTMASEQRVTKILDDPGCIRVPSDLAGKPWVFEWSPNPDFIPSVGYFGQGKEFFFPDTCLNKLAPGTYYMRFGERKSWASRKDILCWVKR